MKVGCPEELLFDLVEGEEHREVALADGALSYAVASCRSGPCAGTIVLIHGVGSNASRWEEFTEQTPLREGWRIIRLDLRGHGASESREKATLEIHAADLMRVLDDAGIEKAVLVGHSLGAHASVGHAAARRLSVSAVADLGSASLSFSSLSGWAERGLRDRFVALTDAVWRVLRTIEQSA